MVDFYRLGTDCDEEEGYEIPRDKRPIKVGALVYTPGAILAEMNTVKASIETLNRDVLASNVRPVFLDAWIAFRKEWEAFYKDHEGWTDRLWGSAMDKTKEFGKRVEGWRDGLKKEGGKPTGPSVPDTGIPWKTIAWGVGIVGGLAAVAVIVREVGSTVRTFKSHSTEEDDAA